MIYSMILASGIGKRMCTDIPKQFLILKNKPIIIHTIEKFLLSNKIDKIIVVVSNQWKKYLEDIFNEYEINNISIVIGGETRTESLINGCKYIKENYDVSNKDIILTHDAVRPFITNRIIEENINKIEIYDAVTTAYPVVDTILKIKKEIVQEIPERADMLLCQTPQTFKLNEFINILETLTTEDKEGLTDASKIYVLKNKKVGYVLGEQSNIKITTKLDLEIAKKIIEK